jgi:chaperonin GroES
MATAYADVEKPKRVDTISRLQSYLDAENIADMLEDDQLGSIGDRVVREYDIDKASRSEWETNSREAMDLAMQVATTKNYPWPKAANIKYPLLTSATIQFAARAYPAILGQGDPVKAQVVGNDAGIPMQQGQGQPQGGPMAPLQAGPMQPGGMVEGQPQPAPQGQPQEQQWEVEPGAKRKRGDRVARHMSWQLTEEMEEWEEDVDKLLHILPIVGMCYKKTYFDPVLGRNRSDLVTADKCVVNDGATDLETVPRITQEVEFYPYEIEEKYRAGVWRKCELGLPQDSANDDDAPHMFLEQHRLYDLDEDGYAEPYICTVHKATCQVVRIVANFREDGVMFGDDGNIVRIERDHYFTKIPFLPNPSGGFHDIGFGYLLRPLNEAVNTTLNQMLDAGHLANTQSGFIGSGARLRGGQMRFKMGQFQQVDVSGGTLRDNLVPFQFPGPNLVLFQLLGLLIEAAKDISSVKDIMTGEAQGRNQSPTTTMALIEQGMQVFSAIYKRIFRSLRKEYKKLYNLNARYLNPETYFTVLDEQEMVGPEDYNTKDYDIVPVADPRAVTHMQKLARAEYLGGFANDPYFNGIEVRRRMLDAASIDDIDELLVEQPPPNPQILKDADELELKKGKLILDGLEVEGNLAKMEAEIVKLLAEAEGIEPGQQMQAYLGLMQQLNERAKLAVQTKKGEGQAKTSMADDAH